MITTPVIVVIVKIRSEIFRILDLQGIDFCTRKIIPVIDIIGKYATSKLDGVILTDGAEFFRSIIVFRNEYFMLHIDSAETNRREGMPWIKVNSNTKTINVNQALSDQSSILHFYKDLISLRKTYASLRYGDFEVMYAKRGLFMFRRKDKEDTFVTMINMTKKTLKLPLHVDGHIMMKNYDNLNTYLKPYECRLIKENAHDSK